MNTNSPLADGRGGLRTIAFYLPQFHPIPENDAWWGEGFTEWTNTAKALPLFEGHYQPHVPADLGFYDLRRPEVRDQQAALAATYGVHAFCYYHYWFAGRRLLELPFNEVLASGRPDFPFCLCWANQSWTGIWHGAPDRTLIKQTYPGVEDYSRHFDFLVKAFTDRRYVTVQEKPLFLIYAPQDIPDVRSVIRYWRERAQAAGLPGLHLVGVRHHPSSWNPNADGFDASVTMRLPPPYPAGTFGKKLVVLQHSEIVDSLVAQDEAGLRDYPSVGPSWDNTPRSGVRGIVLHQSHPDLFRRNLRQAVARALRRDPSERFVFIKAWNEWAEGNHLEPDVKFGHGWLEAVRDETSGA
jgi:lipopolysaccharide biosynthesis protein